MENEAESAEQQLLNIGVVAALLLTISCTFTASLSPEAWDRNDLRACCFRVASQKAAGLDETDVVKFKNFLMRTLEKQNFDFNLDFGNGEVYDVRDTDFLNMAPMDTPNWPRDFTWFETVCATPTALVVLAAIPTDRFRAWQLTPTGNVLCPRATDYTIFTGLTQNTFVSTNLISGSLLLAAVVFSLLGMISLWLSGAKDAIYGRADPTRFYRWNAIMKPTTIAVMIMTLAGMIFCFSAMLRVILASGTHAALMIVCFKSISFFTVLMGLIIFLIGAAFARARGCPSRCDCNDFDVVDENSGQGNGKRSVAVTEAKL